MHGTTLKTSYEIALNRFIKPNYSEPKEYSEPKGLDYMPDFVEDHKSPHKKPQSTEYDKAFIEADIKDEKKNDASTVQKENTVQVEEPQTLHYDNIPELHWYGNFTSYTGFSKMNRVFAFGLSNKNVKIKIDMQDCPIEVNDATIQELEILKNNDIDPKAPKVFGATIPLRFLHKGRKILYTMMENSETLHKDYVDKLNMFQEIWVPTNFNKNMFKNNGVNVPIYVMPLGVDTQRYNETIKPFDFKFALNDFVFLSVFKWNYRKGWDILLKAFLEEFNAQEPVSLLIVSRTDVNHNRNTILNDFMSAKNSVVKENKEYPHVALFDEKIKEKDMPKIYKRANAFTLISRGEGFGLGYVEAAACGIPIIASNCSGQTDYLNHNNSYLVEPEGYTKAELNGNLSRLAKHCRFYEDQIFPIFERQSIEKTKEYMRYVYENYSQAKEKANILTQKIHNEYSWDKAIDSVYNRVLELE